MQIATKDSQIGILLDQLREANARLALSASQLAPLLEAVERSGDPHHPQLDRCHWNGQVGTRSIHSETWVRPPATTELLIADAPKGNLFGPRGSRLDGSIELDHQLCHALQLGAHVSVTDDASLGCFDGQGVSAYEQKTQQSPC